MSDSMPTDKFVVTDKEIRRTWFYHDNTFDRTGKPRPPRLNFQNQFLVWVRENIGLRNISVSYEYFQLGESKMSDDIGTKCPVITFVRPEDCFLCQMAWSSGAVYMPKR